MGDGSRETGATKIVIRREKEKIERNICGSIILGRVSIYDTAPV